MKNFKLVETPQLKYLVTFVPNKNEPIHNWYWFKEGFSKQLVDIFLENFEIKKDNIILDPFIGVGTTCLACKQREIPSIGFDCSPLCVFVSKVKTADYNLTSLDKLVNSALKWKFQRPKEIVEQKYLRKIFSRYALEDIIFYKNKIAEVEDEQIRNFLLLALIDSATKASWAVKDGAFVRITKKATLPVGKLFKWKIRRMLRDLKVANLGPIETSVEIGDARKIALDNESVSAVISSPPYLNKIEYTKIYKMELSLFFNLPESQMRSYIGATKESNIEMEGFVELPPAAQAYFSDMSLVLKELYRVCKLNSKLALVIGGGCFPQRVVESDIITASLARQIGFKVKKILVARKSWCTRARTIKVGQMRESVILLERI